ncbi:response regulator [Elusimicrobiota bacterium]
MHTQPSRGRPAEGISAYPDKRVLVVAGKQVIRRTLRRLLDGFGCRTASAQTGRDAVEAFRAAGKAGTPFDAVILDVSLNGDLDGDDLLERLREAAPRVSVIVTSSYLDDPSMSCRSERGFEAVISKPFGVRDVGGALDEAFHR